MKRRMLAWGIGLVLGTSLGGWDQGLAGEITQADLKQRIVNYVTEHSSWKEDQVEVEILAVTPKPVIPEGVLSMEIRPAPRAVLIGKTDFSLQVRMPGGGTQTFRISARLKVWEGVVLAAHPLKGGDEIRTDDVYVGKQDLGDLAPGYLSDLSDVVGMKTRHFVGANQPLIRNNLKEPPVFLRGDRVWIVAESDLLRILAAGEAKEEGYRGRTARVINLQSRKEVLGEVAGDGTVRVRF
ncbi:MAG: flagellar basal body P-ring formation protein FlgA [Nitrospirae bacterium]|nr:flagellar basal body P-ring formation protein FlgA [Nitrospirota bacterium]